MHCSDEISSSGWTDLFNIGYHVTSENNVECFRSVTLFQDNTPSFVAVIIQSVFGKY